MLLFSDDSNLLFNFIINIGSYFRYRLPTLQFISVESVLDQTGCQPVKGLAHFHQLGFMLLFSGQVVFFKWIPFLVIQFLMPQIVPVPGNC